MIKFIFTILILFTSVLSAVAQQSTEYQGIIYGTDKAKADTSMEAIRLEEQKINLTETKKDLLSTPKTAETTGNSDLSIEKNIKISEPAEGAFENNYIIREQLKTDGNTEIKPEIKKKKYHKLFYLLGGIAVILILL